MEISTACITQEDQRAEESQQSKEMGWIIIQTVKTIMTWAMVIMRMLEHQ